MVNDCIDYRCTNINSVIISSLYTIQIICQLYNTFKNHNTNFTKGYVFIVVTPLAKKEKGKYYLMQFTKIKMNLLEDYDDKGLTYQRGSIILKLFFSTNPRH